MIDMTPVLMISMAAMAVLSIYLFTTRNMVEEGREKRKAILAEFNQDSK